MIKILSKIDGINNVLENNNLLEIEFEKNNIIKIFNELKDNTELNFNCLLYTSPSPRDRTRSRMPSSA